ALGGAAGGAGFGGSGAGAAPAGRGAAGAAGAGSCGCEPEVAGATAASGGAGGFAAGAAGAAGRAGAGSLRPSRFLSDIRVKREIPLRVSNTPVPVTAEASKWGQLWRLSAAFISSTEQMSARSRLLNWRTRGRVSTASPI